MTDQHSTPPAARGRERGAVAAAPPAGAVSYGPIALGALLFLAPVLFGFAGGGAAALSAYAFGAAIAGVGLFALLRRPGWAARALVGVGLVAALAPFALGAAATAAALWAHALVGVATAALGVFVLTRRDAPSVGHLGR